MDTGVKGTLSRFTNKVSVMRLAEGEMKTDLEFTGSSNLDEKILAAYTSWKWQPNPNWGIQGGLRYEYTNTS